MRIWVKTGDESDTFSRLCDIGEMAEMAKKVWIDSKEGNECVDVSHCVFPVLKDFRSSGDVIITGVMEMLEHSPYLERLSANFMSHTNVAVFPRLPRLEYLHIKTCWMERKYLDLRNLGACYFEFRVGKDHKISYNRNRIGLIRADKLIIDDITCEASARCVWANESNFPTEMRIGDIPKYHHESTAESYATIEAFEKKHGDLFEYLNLDPLPNSRTKSASGFGSKPIRPDGWLDARIDDALVGYEF